MPIDAISKLLVEIGIFQLSFRTLCKKAVVKWIEHRLKKVLLIVILYQIITINAKRKSLCDVGGDWVG